MSDGAPVRWRVTIDDWKMKLYENRRVAADVAKLASLKGHTVTITRVETVSRRWRVSGVLCLVWRCWWTKRWFWAAGEADNVLDDRGASYAEAVEAAERAARGQR